jgi:small subunit ribosomal protein S21
LLVVVVKDGNVDYAIKSLRRKMQREGVFRTIKVKRFYEPPSLERKRKYQENCKRRKKIISKIIEV